MYGKHVWERLQELKRCEVPWDVLLRGGSAHALGRSLRPGSRLTAASSPIVRAVTTRQPGKRAAARHRHLRLHHQRGPRALQACILPRHAAAKKPRSSPSTKKSGMCHDHTAREPASQHPLSPGSHSRTDVRGVFAESTSAGPPPWRSSRTATSICPTIPTRRPTGS